MEDTVKEIASQAGFGVHPFKVGWYNDKVDERFKLPYKDDTLGFNFISSRETFDKTIKPFLKDNIGVDAPIGMCMEQLFGRIKQAFPKEDISTILDSVLLPSGEGKVLVQTVGHVAGAIFYYQKYDLDRDLWKKIDKDGNIYGVSIHPTYGGWFSFRGVLIFKNVVKPDLPQKSPPDVVPTQEERLKLLYEYNKEYLNWRYRDIFPVDLELRYTDSEKNFCRKYPTASPGERRELVKELLASPAQET